MKFHLIKNIGELKSILQKLSVNPVRGTLIFRNYSSNQTLSVGSDLFEFHGDKSLCLKFLDEFKRSGFSIKNVVVRDLSGEKQLGEKISDLRDEIWVEFIDGYQVSNYGRVKSFKNLKSFGELLKGGLTKAGYHYVSIQGKNEYVHRLVALFFVNNPSNLNRREVNHLDGDKSNNHFSNLAWVDRAMNQKHALITGLYKRGSKSQHAKKVECLKNGNVIKEFNSGMEAAEFAGVSRHNMYTMIKRGTTRSGYSYRYSKI